MIETTYDKEGKVCCIHTQGNGHNCECHYRKSETKLKIQADNYWRKNYERR